MPETNKQQADWLKLWQESQETMMKKYAGWGEEWTNMLSENKMAPDLFKGWFQSQGDMEGQFAEFSKRLSEMARNAWGDKIPAEMLKFMDISFFGDFYKNWLSSLNLPEGMKTPLGMDGGWQQATEFLHSFLEKNNSYFSSFNNSKITEQMNRTFGMLLGTLGQEEDALSNFMKGYQDYFSKIFESTTAQSSEKMAEVFDAWAKGMEKHLSAPKLGSNRELAHDLSQSLVLSQQYLQAYSKLARLVEATSRRAGTLFQSKLKEAALKNEPVNKFVDLCALWSVENETVFTEVMGSQEFAKLQGDFLNAGHRMKIHTNKLAERALEQTPIALKRDLDLAIAEITQLKRDMRVLQRELRENGNEMLLLRQAQAAAEEEAKHTKNVMNAAEATAPVEGEKVKAVRTGQGPAKLAKNDSKSGKAATVAAASTRSDNV
jgi:hypothetical protein